MTRHFIADQLAGSSIRTPKTKETSMGATLFSRFVCEPWRRTGKPSSRRWVPTVEALEVRRLLSQAKLPTLGAELFGAATKTPAFFAAAGSHGRAAQNTPAAEPLLTPNPGAAAIAVPEAEARGADGQNDTQATAQFV